MCLWYHCDTIARCSTSVPLRAGSTSGVRLLHAGRAPVGGVQMPMYIVLYRFTALGRRDIRGTVERAAEVRKRNEARGLTVHGLYWTQGQYDIVALVEAPNEQE